MRCPFCDSPLVPAIFGREPCLVLGHRNCNSRESCDGVVHFTVCLQCGARGPMAETEQDALAAWNFGVDRGTLTHGLPQPPLDLSTSIRIAQPSPNSPR